MAFAPCSAPNPGSTSRASEGRTITCRTIRPKIPAAHSTPWGTLAKNEVISSESESSGISSSPTKNMWKANPHSAKKPGLASDSRSALLTTPPSFSIQSVMPKNAQATVAACVTTRTAIVYARTR